MSTRYKKLILVISVFFSIIISFTNLVFLQQARGQDSFVLEVKLNLPHKIPVNYSDGLWISSVPMRLDVLVFPEKFRGGKYKYVGKVDKSEDASPHYVGKTPLYLKLKPGKYEVVIFHPPLEEIDRTYKQEWESHGAIQSPQNPFIGAPVLMAVEGRYFWSGVWEIEIDHGLKTVIGLFQRKDKPFTYLLDFLPKEKHFLPFFPNNKNFESPYREYLKDFSKLDSKLVGRLVDHDIEKAFELIRRGGVFGWETDKGDQVIIEVRRKGINIRKFFVE